MSESDGPGDEPFILCDGLVRIYTGDRIEVVALQGLDLEVERGEFVAIVGASGSGKSTLLTILSGNDRPTAGRVRVGDTDLLRLSRAEQLRYRRHTAGFVWQQSSRNLLPYLTGSQNVALPLLATRTRRRTRAARVAELLALLGIEHCAGRTPAQMSGGEQQRLAIAVALANAPQVLFADEPTGELDTASAELVLAGLRRANAELGTTVVLVTHDPLVADTSDRTVAIRDGRTSSESIRRQPTHDARPADDATVLDSPASIRRDDYAVLDRAGRLQLPREFTDALSLRRRVRLQLEPDHVGVWPAETTDGAREPEPFVDQR